MPWHEEGEEKGDKETVQCHTVKVNHSVLKSSLGTIYINIIEAFFSFLFCLVNS